jgi:hypothetical protein
MTNLVNERAWKRQDSQSQIPNPVPYLTGTAPLTWPSVLKRVFDLTPIRFFDTGRTPSKVYLAAPMASYEGISYNVSIDLLHKLFPKTEIVAPLAVIRQPKTG